MKWAMVAVIFLVLAAPFIAIALGLFDKWKERNKWRP
jgi:hypothetical protein